MPYSQAELPDPLPATLVAFYLPQFHSIPENDEWWGKGFTEWRNVTRALPQFEGHVQPRLPGDLGFYDLRDPEVMREQARLAREYGIGAFCFYFYWFGGKTLLEQPLRNWLANRSIDLPFCLCWANEKWSRTWDGRGQDVLIEQCHSAEDDLAFIEYVSAYLNDPRYLRVDGKPLLLVYRPGLLPNAGATMARWRDWCRKAGIGDIHLAYVQSFDRISPASINCDSAVEFPPNLSLADSVTGDLHLINPDFRGSAFDWNTLIRNADAVEAPGYLLHPGVSPSWDNEARRPGAGRSFLYSSPFAFSAWLRKAISRATARSDDPLVFINAWNEWAEGAVLEPDARMGYAYLEAVRNALARPREPLIDRVRPVHVVVHAFFMDAFHEIIHSLLAADVPWHVMVTTHADNAPAIREYLTSLGTPHEIFVYENRGRDILPFLKVASHLRDRGVDFVLKLHTKQSNHRSDGSCWRSELVSRLIGSGRAILVRDALHDQPDLGMVVPEGHYLPIERYQGANADNIDFLARSIRAGTDWRSGAFASGSMFWIRLSALAPLLDVQLSEGSFETEAGQIDGTLAHAIERIFAVTAQGTGHRIATAAEISGEQSPTPQRYWYADPS